MNKLAAACRLRPSVLLKEHRSEILELASKSGASNVRVFGSVARDEDTHDSDIDLLMDFEPGTSVFTLAGLQAELEELLGVHVDVVGDSKRQPRRGKTILANARREAVAL